MVQPHSYNVSPSVWWLSALEGGRCDTAFVVHYPYQVYSILLNDEPQLSLFNVEAVHIWIYDHFRANNVYIILDLVSSSMWLELSALLGAFVDVMSVPVHRFDAQSDAIFICLYSNKSIYVSLFS